MERNLTDLITGLDIISLRGAPDISVCGLSYDAFTVEPGELFLANEGVNVDRHQYIEDVEERGIKAIVHSKSLPVYKPDVTYVQVANVKQSMSPIAAAFYDFPSRKIKVIGVTGTNGKSTTASMVYQLLRIIEKPAGILSSVYFDTGCGIQKNLAHASTPEATAVQKHLFDAVANGLEFFVLEATSHGLSAKNNRVGDVAFEVGIATNISHEHLEFHGTMERYVDDKANLFRLVETLGSENGFCVANADDDWIGAFQAVISKPVFTYAVNAAADLTAANIKGTADSSSFVLNTKGESFPTTVPLPGKFNVYNAMAALLAVSNLTGGNPREIAGKLSDLEPIEGRMEPVSAGQPFAVIVDFAHTPDSFEKLLPEVKRACAGRLILVFGSAGERDTKKRPIQGKIASDNADVIILTDEDPRGEEPMAIIDDIAIGCESGAVLYKIPNRRDAIARAMEIAEEQDTILLLGKGHETSIAYKSGAIPWNEGEIARKCLAEVGYQ